MAYEAIRHELADAVATITLNRPNVHNAMNERMREELTACFTELAQCGEARAIVVTGAGEKAFSAGADIPEFVTPQVPVKFRDGRRRVDFRAAMDRCGQPIIAAIRGFALGGALEMILTGARIDAREALRIGLVERVVPAAEVQSAAQTLARTLAERAPIAMRYAKEAVVKGLGMSLEDGLRLENDLATLLRTTEDRIEGAKAFLEKRKPRFTGQ